MKIRRVIFAVAALISFLTMFGFWGAIDSGRADPLYAGVGSVIAALLCVASLYFACAFGSADEE